MFPTSTVWMFGNIDDDGTGIASDDVGREQKADHGDGRAIIIVTKRAEQNGGTR